jgi:hypothetical protein
MRKGSDILVPAGLFQAANLTQIGLRHGWPETNDKGYGFFWEHHASRGEPDSGSSWVKQGIDLRLADFDRPFRVAGAEGGGGLQSFSLDLLPDTPTDLLREVLHGGIAQPIVQMAATTRCAPAR